MTAITALGGALAGVLWFIVSKPEIAVVVLAAAAILAVSAWRKSRHVPIAALAGAAAIRGLQPFEERDADLLTSLNQQTTELLTAVGGSEFRYGLLYGDPNCGKTSFVKARLIPAFTADGGRTGYVDGVAEHVSSLEQPIVAKICEVLGRPMHDRRLGTLLDDLQDREVPRVLIVWDRFDTVVGQFPDPVERVGKLKELGRLVTDSKHRIRLLFVCSTGFHETVARDLVAAFGMRADDERKLDRLKTQTAIEVLKQFVDHDARLGLPRLSGAVCERIGRGLADKGTVCPAELQIVAEQLRANKVYDEAGLLGVGDVRGVITAFIASRLSAQGTPGGLVRDVLSLLAGASDHAAASPVAPMGPDDVAQALGAADHKDRIDAIKMVLDDLVKDDLAVCLPQGKYMLVHEYMRPNVIDALKGLKPPAPSLLDRILAVGPTIGMIAASAAAIAAVVFVLVSWFTWGPHQRSTLPGPKLVYSGRVAFDPHDRYVLAQVTPPDSILVWDRFNPQADATSLNCGTNPSLLTMDFPSGLGHGAALQSAEFSQDGQSVRAIGTSISDGRLWILTWSLGALCNPPTLLAGDYPSHADSGATCAAQDVAYNETLQKAAVAYDAVSGTDAAETCHLIALLPVEQATEIGQSSGASLRELGRRTTYTPITLAFEPVSGSLLVLTQGSDQQQYSEGFDMQLRAGTPRSLQRRGGYGIFIVNGHMNVVVEVDPFKSSQPFWTRPPLSWFMPQQGLLIEDWDSDLNLLRFWVSGAIQGNRPPAGFSADGKWLVVIRDGADQPVYEMTSELAGYNVPTVPLPFLN
ncbi:MAG: hypothetical protein JOZ81_34760 [Chloroflexi bacterium]|nr:hypothetical protein [Chloroflexota bacterium]